MQMMNFDEFVLEKKNHRHKYGCMLLMLNIDNWESILSEIDEKDLYIEKDDDSYGLEKNPHVSIKYGFTSSADSSKIMKTCIKFNFSTLSLKNVSLFKNEKCEVLKFDISSKKLKKINSLISKYPNEDEFKEYHPHCTIAYLKTGTGEKYVEKFKDIEVKATPSSFIFSNTDGINQVYDL